MPQLLHVAVWRQVDIAVFDLLRHGCRAMRGGDVGGACNKVGWRRGKEAAQGTLLSRCPSSPFSTPSRFTLALSRTAAGAFFVRLEQDVCGSVFQRGVQCQRCANGIVVGLLELCALWEKGGEQAGSVVRQVPCPCVDGVCLPLYSCDHMRRVSLHNPVALLAPVLPLRRAPLPWGWCRAQASFL